MANYKNPPIKTVSCEMKLRKDGWNDIFIGQLYDKLKDKYPLYDSVVRIINYYDKDKKSIFPKEIKETKLYREGSEDCFFVSPNRVEFQKNGNYEGWDIIKGEIVDVFSAYLQIVNPEKIKLLNLNYFNRIDIPVVLGQEYIDSVEYFNIDIDIRKLSFGHSCFQSDLRLLFDTGEKSQLELTLSDVVFNENELSNMVGIAYKSFDYVDVNNIGDNLDVAHSQIEKLFEELITDKTRGLFY